jgi:hypothetical protein
MFFINKKLHKLHINGKKHMLHNKDNVLEDFRIVNKKYQKITPNKPCTRKFYRKNGTYAESVWTNMFGSFKKFKQEALKGELLSTTLTRNDINVYISSKDMKNKRYIITSAIAGCDLHEDFVAAISTYCKHNNSELVILPIKGTSRDTQYFTEEVMQYQNSFATEYTFNNNLQAKEFVLSPLQVNPLTSLNRYGNKKSSLIVGSPKQQMMVVPIAKEKLPHILYSTGAITVPDYPNTKSGILAKQDHVVGGLIIEIQNEEIFHVRMIQCDEEGGFYDLDNYYSRTKVKKIYNHAFIMGDLHIGSEDPKAIKAWKECITQIKAKQVVMHDILDNRSINPHEEKNIIKRATLPEMSKTLKSELSMVGRTLHQWSSEFKNTKFIIVKSNHDSWLDEFLKKGRYAQLDHIENHILCLDLAKDLVLGKNPVEEYLNKSYNLKNFKWLNIESDYRICGIQCGAHGHMGANGARGSSKSMDIIFDNSISGHTHSPLILRNTMIVGTSTKLQLDYNIGGGSTWLHASAIIYPNGKRTLIIAVNGQWKI